MVAGSYTVVSVLDEVRLALNMKGTDAFLSDDEIERFIYDNVDGTTRSTWQFYLITASAAGATGVFKCSHGYPYGLFLHGPTMTAEDDCVYVINSRGSIAVTSGTPTANPIEVTGIRVDFPNVMVQVLHWLASHRSMEISASAGSGSLSSSGVQESLLRMADYWTGIQQIA